MSQAHPQPSKTPAVSPMSWLLTLLAPERRDIIVVIVFAIGVGVLMLSTPVAVQALVNTVSFGSLTQPLIVLGLMLLFVLVLAGAIRGLKALVVEQLQRRLFVRVVTDLSQRLPRVHVSSFDRHHGPELVNRFFDVLTVQKVGATLLLDGVAVVLQTCIGLLILGFYHPLLLAFDVVLVAGIAVVLFGLGRGAVRTAIEESKAKYAVEASLEEIARNPTTFKLAGGLEYARQRADALAVEYVESRRRHFRVVFRQIVGSLALQALAATALLTLGGWLVIEGQLTLGQLVASELIVSIVLASFTKLGRKLESFYDLLAAADKLGQLFDLPLERTSGESHVPSQGGAALVLQDVSFVYDDGGRALPGLSLSLRPRERVCIVGRHGSGKSTLADILYGLRTPTAGHVQLDGIDLRDLSLDSIRSQVAVVKGLEIIEASIETNVHMNRPQVTNADMRASLDAVGLLDEIRELLEGLATTLMSNGAPLSYGQARRLMLARAIASRPRLLVLDDILDELDDDARQRAAGVLLAPDAPWTLIILSRHRWIFEGIDRNIVLANDDPSDLSSQISPMESETVKP